MKVELIKITLYIILSVNIISCQSQLSTDVVSTPKADIKSTSLAYPPAPCKNVSSSLVKDKTKIKNMLLNEGKINSEMTKEEINRYVNQYIKNKSTKRCKPMLKKTTKTEKTPHA